MQIQKIHITVISAVFLILSGCRKFVTIEPSPNLVTSNDLFNNETAAISAVLGQYIQMRSTNLGIFNGGLSVYTSLSADDIINTVSNKTADAFRKNDLLPNNSTISVSFWSNAYRNIYHINAVLDGLSNTVNIRPTVKNQLVGEMKFARAMYYFNLSNLFGDIPLIIGTNYEANQSKPRTAIPTIRQMVIDDLKDAKKLLSETYVGKQHSRPNKWCAATLLSKVYLYSQNWQGAFTEADSVINSGQYQLETDLTKVFQPESHEIIWQIVRDEANTTEGAVFVPASPTSRPTYILADSLLHAFSSQDKRLNWIDSTTYRNTVYHYPAKYKARGTSPILEYLVAFRLAELFLIRSEAQLRLHNLAQATDDLNMIKSRAGLSPVSNLNEDNLLHEIILERRREYFAEWGNRWFDLKRLNLAESVLAPLKLSNWQATDTLYPIPETELERNPNLIQNPGY